LADFNFCCFSKINDQSIAYGLEYPLFDILEEPIKNNIELLLDEHNWISERIICDLYNVRKKIVCNICLTPKVFLFLGKIWVFVCSLQTVGF